MHFKLNANDFNRFFSPSRKVGVIALVGTNDVTGGSGGKTYPVSQIQIHKRYKQYHISGGGAMQVNDIALVRADGLQLNDRVKTIDVSSQPLPDGASVTFSGWGYFDVSIEKFYQKFVAIKYTYPHNFF